MIAVRRTRREVDPGYPQVLQPVPLHGCDVSRPPTTWPISRAVRSRMVSGFNLILSLARFFMVNPPADDERSTDAHGSVRTCRHDIVSGSSLSTTGMDRNS